MTKVTLFKKFNIVVLRLIFYQCAKFQIVCELGYEIIQLQSYSYTRALMEVPW